MKKSVIMFIVIFSILSFSSCGTKVEKLEDVVATTPEIKTSDPESPMNTRDIVTSDSVPSNMIPEIETSNTELPTVPRTPEPTPTDLYIDYYKDVTYEITACLSEDMPIYRFVAAGMTYDIGEWSRGDVMGLEVYDENELPILSVDFSQMIDGEVMGNFVYNQMMDTMGLHVVDVNFDGYKDVIILNSFGGAHSNSWYDCWLWDTETSSFVESESFAEICNPALDQEKKCIYSSGGSGADHRDWYIYQFIDGEFVITNILSYNERVNGEYRFIEQKLVNGEMEVLRDEVLQASTFNEVLSITGYNNDDLWQLDNSRWYGYGGHHADQWLE